MSMRRRTTHLEIVWVRRNGGRYDHAWAWLEKQNKSEALCRYPIKEHDAQNEAPLGEACPLCMELLAIRKLEQSVGGD